MHVAAVPETTHMFMQMENHIAESDITGQSLRQSGALNSAIQRLECQSQQWLSDPLLAAMVCTLLNLVMAL
jgi:hypothetical protein